MLVRFPKEPDDTVILAPLFDFREDKYREKPAVDHPDRPVADSGSVLVSE